MMTATKVRRAAIEDRAKRAYFRLYGNHANQPGWIDIRGKKVTLGNVNGPLAQFKIVSSQNGFRLMQD